MKIKFNIIDAIVILLIIAVGAAGYLFLNGRSEIVSNDQNVKIRYDIELAAKDEYMVGQFKEGDKVIVGEKEKFPATVIGVRTSPARQSSFDGVSGTYLNAEMPEKYDITVTLESDGVNGTGQVSVNGTAVRVGMSAAVRGRDYAGYGYVTGISIRE